MKRTLQLGLTYLFTLIILPCCDMVTELIDPSENDNSNSATQAPAKPSGNYLTIVGEWESNCALVSDMEKEEDSQLPYEPMNHSAPDDLEEEIEEEGESSDSDEGLAEEWLTEHCKEALGKDYEYHPEDYSLLLYACTFDADIPLTATWEDSCQEGFNSFKETQLLGDELIRIGCLKEEESPSNSRNFIVDVFNLKYCQDGIHYDVEVDAEFVSDLPLSVHCIMDKETPMPEGWQRICQGEMESFEKEGALDTKEYGCKIIDYEENTSLKSYANIYQHRFCDSGNFHYAYDLESSSLELGAFSCLMAKDQPLVAGWEVSCPEYFEAYQEEAPWNSKFTIFGCYERHFARPTPNEWDYYAASQKGGGIFIETYCQDAESHNDIAFNDLGEELIISYQCSYSEDQEIPSDWDSDCPKGFFPFQENRTIGCKLEDAKLNPKSSKQFQKFDGKGELHLKIESYISENCQGSPYVKNKTYQYQIGNRLDSGVTELNLTNGEFQTFLSFQLHPQHLSFSVMKSYNLDVDKRPVVQSQVIKFKRP